MEPAGRRCWARIQAATASRGPFREIIEPAHTINGDTRGSTTAVTPSTPSISSLAHAVPELVARPAVLGSAARTSWARAELRPSLWARVEALPREEFALLPVRFHATPTGARRPQEGVGRSPLDLGPLVRSSAEDSTPRRECQCRHDAPGLDHSRRRPTRHRPATRHTCRTNWGIGSPIARRTLVPPPTSTLVGNVIPSPAGKCAPVSGLVTNLLVPPDARVGSPKPSRCVAPNRGQGSRSRPRARRECC